MTLWQMLRKFLFGCLLLGAFLVGAFSGAFYNYVKTWDELATEGGRMALLGEAMVIQTVHELRP